MSFRDRFIDLRKERKTFLCVGLDPALPNQRKEMIIPKNYSDFDENEARLKFCLDIIDNVADYAIAVKPNQQYLFGFTKKQHQKLTNSVRKKGLLSILDYKLNDIGSTIESAIFHISEAGYDAITFNPFPGNLKKTVQYAHYSAKELRGYELGIFVLTLMSNPEATVFVKNAKINNLPVFKFISRQVMDCDADGCVIGTTGHVTEKNVKEVREIVGLDKIFLMPGVGAQKGDFRRLLGVAGKNVLVNVGRYIIYSSNPAKKAEYYNKILNTIIQA